MDIIKWTIQPVRGLATFAKLDFDTKRKAVAAMIADREPKTPIVRDLHDYVYTKKKD